MVANLTDDNGDTRIDTDDIPDVVFMGGENLCAVSGDTGQEIFCSASPADPLEEECHPAVGDINGDDLPEIVVLTNGRTDPSPNLVAFTHEGVLFWESDPVSISAAQEGGGPGG